MLAYSRGSNCLAGAAPLEHRVPAVVGSFCPNLDIAQWVEQQPDKLSVAGSTPAIRLLCKQLATTSDPGRVPALHAR
jgi:hypothetical protein